MHRIKLYIVPESEEHEGGDESENDPSRGGLAARQLSQSPGKRGQRSILRINMGRNHHEEVQNGGRKGDDFMKKEYDLEQKIELEIKMREGTTKLLAACNAQSRGANSAHAQSLEAAKNLLTSNERMSAYMAELQRRKKDPRSTSHRACAKVSLSDVRMPLMWRDTDHFKNKGDYRRFAVFCLVRIGTEIFDTTMLCPVDRSLTDITFPDVLLFSNVPPDFECRLEIFSHELQDDMSIASTPRKIKKTIHTSISRTVGKKLAATLRDELQSGKIGPSFELMASATLCLRDSHDQVHTHDMVLTRGNDKNNSRLPLFGHFCGRLAVLPDSIARSVMSGDLQVSSGNIFQEGWANLQAFRLELFSGQVQWENGQGPVLAIRIDNDSHIQASVTNPRDITVANIVNGRNENVNLRARTRDECLRWLRALKQHAEEQALWGPAGQGVPMYMPVQDTRAFKAGRQGSLYDETPINESTTNSLRSAHRPTVHEVFGLTPSPSLNSCVSTTDAPFRDLSYSTIRSNNSTNSNSTNSSSNSTQSSVSNHSMTNHSHLITKNVNGAAPKAKGTLRSHWPFSSKT